MIVRHSVSFAATLAMLFLVQTTWVQTTLGQELAYHWEPGQKFSYEVEVVVDGSDETITYKGMIHYSVDRADMTQATVRYRGGLSESKKSKQPAGRFGPRGFGPPRFPSPFSRPSFLGKVQTTNTLTLTSRGQTLSMKGNSQLPYLLGNVSLMPFEALPKGEQKEWGIDGGVSITEKENNDRHPFGPFGPMGPFGDRDDSNVQAAGEESSYSIQSSDGNLVVIKKTYRLYTPATENNAAFDMVGNGTWTFDRKDHVPHAYDMNFSLKVTKGNTTTAIPISVKYDRISPEKLAEMEATAKKKAEEMRQEAEAKRVLAETPLTEEETSETLRTLASKDVDKIVETLRRLAEKSLQDPDPKIAAAIERHLTSSDRRVSGDAHKAMVKWSLEYATKKKLEKAYQGPSPVTSTGLIVESTTPLYVGQIVQAQRPRRGSFWRAARVKSLQPDGRVELAFLTWGKERDRDTEIVSRRSIQLAPPELDQPKRTRVAKPSMPATSTLPQVASRTWTDSTGRFKVDGVFVDVTDGNVNLKRADGRTISIPMNKLSDGDQAHVKQLQQTELENPFKLK